MPSLPNEKYATTYFQFVSELDELQNTTPSSHCSSVQERLVNYGSEALDTVEHLGLILKDQNKAATLLKHFGSIANLARASVQDLSAFLSRDKAAQLVSSLRLAAVALREERTRLLIDTPLAVAELCSEMRFLSHESLRSRWRALRMRHSGNPDLLRDLKEGQCWR